MAYRKINHFLKLYEQYKTAKDSYKTNIETFVQDLETVLDNYKTADEEGANTFYNDGTSLFILTPEKVLMRLKDTIQVSDIPSVTTLANGSDDKNAVNDSNLNSIIQFKGSSVYYTDIISSTTSSSVQTNRYNQLGLENLEYTTNSNTSAAYEISDDKKPVMQRVSAVITNGPKINCEIGDMYKCDAYAKFSNSNYYGLGYNRNEKNQDHCECYLFDSQGELGNELNRQLTIIEPSGIDPGSNSHINKKYLGILMDGNISYLSDLIFNNNYNGFYEVNPQKISTLISDPNPDNISSRCHPFTGSGPNTLVINKLSEIDCKIRDSTS